MYNHTISSVIRTVPKRETSRVSKTWVFLFCIVSVESDVVFISSFT